MNRQVYWQREGEPRGAKRLEGVVRTAVAVVGGGVTGLACAQRLCSAGLAVVLVERDFCGAGASGRSSGFVTPDSELELSALIARFGAAEARRLWEFVASGASKIRANIEEHEIACDFQAQDSLFIGKGRKGRRRVLEEHAARRELGYPSRAFEGDGVRETLGTTKYTAAVRYGGTFAMDPYAYCRGLRGELVARGVDVREASPVTRVHADGVETSAGRVRADHVVVAIDRFTPELGVLEQDIFHAQTFLALTQPL
ncbi:MAG TPA: FAD-dependent oxidoreductase, partial [Planctomycetota bacterium]|nr:FAD-dependent oxidoreductase [Planctomycetota bacterium]